MMSRLLTPLMAAWATRGNDPANVGGYERGLTLLGGADRAAEALEGLAHDELMARRGRDFKTGSRVSLGDRGQPAGDGGRAKGVFTAEVQETLGNEKRLGWCNSHFLPIFHLLQ